jgi:CheY-like chemotaxis protein
MATLLLADDSLTVGRSVAQAFALEDIRVEAVVSGERAIAQLEADPPDVILADICMARVNGYDIASYVKRTPGLSHIPVLLLAGPFERVDEARARATGCEGILVKPLQPRILVGVVRDALAGKRLDLWPTNLTHGAWDQEAVGPDEIVIHPPVGPAQPGFDWLAWRASQPSADYTREPLEEGLDHLDEAFEREEAAASAVSTSSNANAAFVRDVRDLTERTQTIAQPPRPPAVPVAQFVASAPVEPFHRAGAASDHLKIKVKIGGNVFEAEGPADLVQAQLESFKRVTGVTPRNSNPGLSMVAPRRRAPRKANEG